MKQKIIRFNLKIKLKNDRYMYIKKTFYKEPTIK